MRLRVYVHHTRLHAREPSWPRVADPATKRGSSTRPATSSPAPGGGRRPAPAAPGKRPRAPASLPAPQPPVPPQAWVKVKVSLKAPKPTSYDQGYALAAGHILADSGCANTLNATFSQLGFVYPITNNKSAAGMPVLMNQCARHLARVCMRGGVSCRCDSSLSERRPLAPAVCTWPTHMCVALYSASPSAPRSPLSVPGPSPCLLDACHHAHAPCQRPLPAAVLSPRYPNGANSDRARTTPYATVQGKPFSLDIDFMNVGLGC